MNTESALAQLRDIHPPGEIGWWPIALPWWILITTIILLIAVLTFLLIRKKRRNAWRKSALHELKLLEEQHHEIPAIELAKETNILLKRCLHSIDDSALDLSLSGKAWSDKLAKPVSKVKLDDDTIAILSSKIYQTNCPKLSKTQLKNIAAWIKGVNNV